jgi:hypothetical protein
MTTVIAQETNKLTDCIYSDAESCISFRIGVCPGQCSDDYMSPKQACEKLKENKEKTEALYRERDYLEKRLPEKVIYQNEDGTWTRFTKTDNFKTIEETGIVWKSTSFGRFSTKFEDLKREPKENKS